MTIRIGITPGEPAGIGPDLVVALAQQEWPVELVVCANRDVLLQRAAALGNDTTPRPPWLRGIPASGPRRWPLTSSAWHNSAVWSADFASDQSAQSKKRWAPLSRSGE